MLNIEFEVMLSCYIEYENFIFFYIFHNKR